MSEQEPTISDLIMLVGRLVHQLRIKDPGNPTAERAMDYLSRKNLVPSVLRDIKKRAGLPNDEVIDGERL